MSDLLNMSTQELTRVEIMQRLKAKSLTQLEAARRLGLSVRQVKRLWRRYQRQGAAGLVSEKRGRPSHHQLAPEVKAQTLSLIRSRYPDFGPTLAHEKLSEVHRLRLSVEAVRQLMIQDELWHPKRAKRPVIHQMRERRPCLGELVQIDGSPFDWFEGRAPTCSLLVFIDDATGRLLELYFTPSETTFSYFAATRRYLERYGKPVAFYSDKHGIFRVNAAQAVSGTGLTQFGRAMTELGIEIICANTPQAKGRVERVHQTLQDRLVKELRLRGLSNLECANAYAPEFMQDFNARFAVLPASPHEAHRPVWPTENLERIFTLQTSRSVSKNLTLQYNKVVYQIQTPRAGYALRQAQVRVREDAQGQITLEYKGRSLPYTLYHTQERQAEVTPSKLIAPALQAAKTERKPYGPPAHHPWRQYGSRLSSTR